MKWAKRSLLQNKARSCRKKANRQEESYSKTEANPKKSKSCRGGWDAQVGRGSTPFSPLVDNTATLCRVRGASTVMLSTGEIMITSGQGDTAEGELAGTYDRAKARRLLEPWCSLCNSLEVVAEAPLASEAEVRELVARRVEGGASGTKEDLAMIIRHLTETHVNEGSP